MMYLYAKNLIFDFATDYLVRHKEKPIMKGFSIGDTEYGLFKEFVKSKGFEYETQSESELKKLISIAKQEKYFDPASVEFAVLEKKLAHDDDKDLNNFRVEIEELINEEVISRYYYQKGRIGLSVESDTQVIRAAKILAEPGVVEKILAKISENLPVNS
jgi:carboxyl-terminal processing protease